MTITLTREEAQQVLDALDFHSDGDVQDLELMGMLRSRLKHSTHASDCAVYNEPAYPAGECDCTARLSAPEPEPDNLAGYRLACSYGVFESRAFDLADKFRELYAPPQREWQGLTDDECLQNPYCAGENDSEVILLARAIEAKLKEKNT